MNHGNLQLPHFRLLYQPFYRAQFKFTTITSNPTKMPGMGVAMSGQQ
jgi:hypothetical protein